MFSDLPEADLAWLAARMDLVTLPAAVVLLSIAGVGAACLDELKRLPVELLTPPDADHIAGILAFRHRAAERIHAHLHRQGVHVMSHAGRLRVAIHGYNTAADVERFVRGLTEALGAV